MSIGQTYVDKETNFLFEQTNRLNHVCQICKQTVHVIKSYVFFMSMFILDLFLASIHIVIERNYMD